MANKHIWQPGDPPAATKETTLHGAVAQAIFSLITYQWVASTELARAVMEKLGKDRPTFASLQHIQAVMRSLYQGGYLEKMVAPCRPHGRNQPLRRQMVHYRLVHRPDTEPQTERKEVA